MYANLGEKFKGILEKDGSPRSIEINRGFFCQRLLDSGLKDQSERNEEEKALEYAI